jgi:hypothetical protein
MQNFSRLIFDINIVQHNLDLFRNLGANDFSCSINKIRKDVGLKMLKALFSKKGA